MEPNKLWQSLSDENKSLAKKISIAALGLYVLLQLVQLFLPLLIFAAIGFWAFQQLIEKKDKTFT